METSYDKAMQLSLSEDLAIPTGFMLPFEHTKPTDFTSLQPSLLSPRWLTLM